MGYTFEWNERGPYCVQVSQDAHEILRKTPQLNSSLNTTMIKNFKEEIESHYNDHEWLEIVASIKYLKREFYANEDSDYVDECLVRDLTVHYKSFPEKLVRETLSNMKGSNL